MNINSIISELGKILSFGNTKAPITPPPTRLLVQNRPGLSALKITNEILKEKQALGIPTGTLDDGTTNLDDVMIRVIVEKIIEAIQQDSRVEIAITPLTGVVTSSGVSASGIPVQTTGVVNSIQTGFGLIQ